MGPEHLLKREKERKHSRSVSKRPFSNSGIVGIPEKSPKELNPREHQIVISIRILPGLAKPYESESLTLASPARVRLHNRLSIQILSVPTINFAPVRAIIRSFDNPLNRVSIIRTTWN